MRVKFVFRVLFVLHPKFRYQMKALSMESLMIYFFAAKIHSLSSYSGVCHGVICEGVLYAGGVICGALQYVLFAQSCFFFYTQSSCFRATSRLFFLLCAVVHKIY